MYQLCHIGRKSCAGKCHRWRSPARILVGNCHNNLVMHVCFSFLAGNDTLVILALQWLNRAGEACQGERGWQEAGAGTGRRGSAPGGVRQVYLVGSGKREMSETSWPGQSLWLRGEGKVTKPNERENYHFLLDIRPKLLSGEVITIRRSSIGA